MNIFKSKKATHVGKHFILTDEEKTKFKISINKIIGQLESLKKDIDNDNTCDESLTQILAIKGGVETVGRNLVGKGVLECLNNYSKSELELIIKNMFKLS